jgi:hypothetical protein
MINGAHLLLYSTDPEPDQEVLRAVLETRSVPAEEGRLILALPPAEIATHIGPATFCQSHCGRDLAGIVLYLMCDNLHSTVEALQARKVVCTAIEDT